MSYKNIVMVGYPDPLSKEAFSKAQELMEVTLPHLLYDLVKENDEGHPKDNTIYLRMPDGEDDVNGLGAFLSFNPRNYSYIAHRYLGKPEHQPQDERFVPFGVTGNGDYFN